MFLFFYVYVGEWNDYVFRLLNHHKWYMYFTTYPLDNYLKEGLYNNNFNFDQDEIMIEIFGKITIKQVKEVIECTNRHYMLCGKLEAIDEELDTFYRL